MKNKLWILLLVPFLYAGDYVCYDKEGNITAKVTSVGASYSSRKDCIKVTREKIESLDRFYKYDANVVGTNDSKIVAMTKETKDAIVAKELKAVEDAKIASIESLEITVKQLVDALVEKKLITKDEIINKVKTDENITTKVEISK